MPLVVPMPLSLEAQALAHLLKSGLHLPAPHEPGDDPLGVCVEIGAQQGLSLEVLSGSRIRTQRNGTGGSPVLYQSAVAEATSTVRSFPLYQSETVMDVQVVAGSSATAERLARRSPL